jgi:hypothetical protein
VYNVIRISLIAAVLLLATIVEANLPVEAVATVDDGTVEWTTSGGDAAASAKPDSTAIFYIVDDALETTKTGTATWTDLNSQGQAGDTFSLSDGQIGGASATYTLSASSYDTDTPANTPLTGSPTVTADGTSQFVSAHSTTGGTFSIIIDVTATPTVATFNHHIVDSWAAGDSATRRAKVSSTSDPAGEYVTISEVSAVGGSTASATAQIFRGTIALSSDATKQGTSSDGVWVQDGDTLTVSYLNDAGTAIDTDDVTVDGVKPTIGAVTPADGTVTSTGNPTVSFDVTDGGSGMASTPGTVITLAINGTTVSADDISFQPITGGYRAFYVTGVAWTAAVNAGGFAVSDSVGFTLTLTATDQAGNVQTVSGDSANVTIDQTVPTVSSAATGADNTAVAVTFSENIKASSIDAADFTVGGSAPTAAVANEDNAKIIDLTVTALASDAKPSVVVVGTVTDEADNAVVADSSVTATDGVLPVLTVAIDKALAILEDDVTITASTDEKLAVDGLKVSVNGTIVATTAPTPNNNEGTVTVASGHGTGMFGVTVQASDGSNVSDNMTAVTDETPSIDATRLILTLANGPVADKNLAGGVTSADITALTSAGADVSGNITAVDASARTITLNTAIAAGAAVLVSYHYVTDTFEIDQAAPTVTFEPADGDAVRNQSPFIRVIWADTEYPGDSYTTVTMSAAVITHPDATTEDVLASFITSDSKEYIWAAKDLALGSYTLTVSGTDVAGNALEDQAITFTVEKRTYTIALRPGWNLVSLPGAPEDSAINTVITSADVDVVLTYDPSDAAKWLNATRGTDGTLSGTLSTIDASRAYWMHANAFVDVVTNIAGLQAGAAGLPPSYDLVAGWNLVPVTTTNVGDTDPDADTYFSGLSWSRAYGYDNSSNSFTGILPDGNEVTAIGKGYWVFLKAAGTLVP